mmetsp:Transcript_116391/g.292742  ORF Transcript_116391/g.292742 Transcript_116391/m.292742 type:complete len:473 (+) Transcript_116391:86-1504(+)
MMASSPRCGLLSVGLVIAWAALAATISAQAAGEGDEGVAQLWNSTDLELRVAKCFGTKDYNQVRISVVSYSATPPVANFFDYSAQFVHRWTQFYLHTAIKTVQPGVDTSFHVGADIAVRLPAQGAGVAGLLIADPCVHSPTGKEWISCQFAARFNTIERIPALINAFAPGPDTDFWTISGDNFYDRTGEISADVFKRVSLAAKSKIFASVPGNHDYWVLGSPGAGSTVDQCANGFMQFYGQDTKAAEHVMAGSSLPPFDFSINPSLHDTDGNMTLSSCNLPALPNFFWYNQIGNVGLVGQSGAYSQKMTMPFMVEACDWLSQQSDLDVVVLFGHWDIAGSGASPEMAMPQWYTEMAALPGCSEFDQRGMLKFVMGHTHCNDPHPHGKVGAGFRVAGFGMEGCGNFGMPIIDTTEGRVRFWYFDTSSDDMFNKTIACVTQKGWRSCTSLATSWLDQPIAPKFGDSNAGHPEFI